MISAAASLWSCLRKSLEWIAPRALAWGHHKPLTSTGKDDSSTYSIAARSSSRETLAKLVAESLMA
jgi:hypothetical protein